MPFAFAPPTSESPAAQMRLFIEPQYLQRPFTAITNPHGEIASIVQLPKIWKHRESPLVEMLENTGEAEEPGLDL